MLNYFKEKRQEKKLKKESQSKGSVVIPTPTPPDVVHAPPETPRQSIKKEDDYEEVQVDIRKLEKLNISVLEAALEERRKRAAPPPPSSRPPETFTSSPKLPSRISSEALHVLQNVHLYPEAAVRSLFLTRIVNDAEEIHDTIHTYIANGQVHGYELAVKNIVRVVRDGDREFQHIPGKKDEFRLMLWHGTTKEAVGSILQTGFVLPKKSGQMFGKGIYFADRASKSANYCGSGSTAYLLLCDVLIGRCYNSKNPKTDLDSAPATSSRKFESVKCTGRKVPDQTQQRIYAGSIVPCGETVENTKFKEYSVEYNEYIVYDPENIKVMFVVEVEKSGKYDCMSVDVHKSVGIS